MPNGPGAELRGGEDAQAGERQRGGGHAAVPSKERRARRQPRTDPPLARASVGMGVHATARRLHVIKTTVRDARSLWPSPMIGRRPAARTGGVHLGRDSPPGSFQGSQAPRPLCDAAARAPDERRAHGMLDRGLALGRRARSAADDRGRAGALRVIICSSARTRSSSVAARLGSLAARSDVYGARSTARSRCPDCSRRC